jgi:hypothetical protein
MEAMNTFIGLLMPCVISSLLPFFSGSGHIFGFLFHFKTTLSIAAKVVLFHQS